MSRLRVASLIVILAISLLFLLPAMALAEESASGTVSGQVINGTEGGGSVAGIDVTLNVYVSGDLDEDKTEITTTDADGKFQFDDVAIENTCLVSAEYEEVSYYYMVIFEDEETTAEVEVYVFDTTESDEAIRVEQAYIIMSVISAEENPGAEEDRLLVTEFFLLVNEGDKTYVGADGVDGAVMVFTLPEGAADFYFYGQELSYEVLYDGRIAYLESFPPEERQVAFNYTLPFADYDTLPIPLHVDYPTDALELRIPAEGIEIASTQLAPADPGVDSAGKLTLRFLCQDFQRDTVINIYITESSGGWGTTLVILCVIAGVVIAGIAVYSLRGSFKGNSDEG